jgi:hypothetical protein
VLEERLPELLSPRRADKGRQVSSGQLRAFLGIEDVRGAGSAALFPSRRTLFTDILLFMTHGFNLVSHSSSSSSSSTAPLRRRICMKSSSIPLARATCSTVTSSHLPHGEK